MILTVKFVSKVLKKTQQIKTICCGEKYQKIMSEARHGLILQEINAQLGGLID